MDVKVRLLSETAQLPKRKSTQDMGFDLYADEDITVQKGDLKKIHTGVSVELPEGYGAFITGRSGLSANTHFRVKLGIIDNGYRGELRIMVDNIGDEPFHIEQGDRIAQFIVLPIPEVELVEVDDLKNAERGDKGFGSSGIK